MFPDIIGTARVVYPIIVAVEVIQVPQIIILGLLSTAVVDIGGTATVVNPHPGQDRRVVIPPEDAQATERGMIIPAAVVKQPAIPLAIPVQQSKAAPITHPVRTNVVVHQATTGTAASVWQEAMKVLVGQTLQPEAVRSKAVVATSGLTGELVPADPMETLTLLQLTVAVVAGHLVDPAPQDLIGCQIMVDTACQMQTDRPHREDPQVDLLVDHLQGLVPQDPTGCQIMVDTVCQTEVARHRVDLTPHLQHRLPEVPVLIPRLLNQLQLLQLLHPLHLQVSLHQRHLQVNQLQLLQLLHQLANQLLHQSKEQALRKIYCNLY